MAVNEGNDCFLCGGDGVIRLVSPPRAVIAPKAGACLCGGVCAMEEVFAPTQ